MEWKLFFTGILALIGIYLMGTVLFRPMRFLFRLAAWALLGGVLLLAMNAVFGPLGFHIAINPVTILTAGILQLPGVALLVLVHYFVLV